MGGGDGVEKERMKEGRKGETKDDKERRKEGRREKRKCGYGKAENKKAENKKGRALVGGFLRKKTAGKEMGWDEPSCEERKRSRRE